MTGNWDRLKPGWSIAVAGVLCLAGVRLQADDGPPPLEGPAPAGGSRVREAPPPPPMPGLFDATRSAPVGGWRLNGPPADHPDDTPGPAPGASAFYVPGHYRPEGDRVVWVPGFWARVQPGWEWVPARWVRRPDDWDFRPGHWVRETEPGRHDAARPAAPPADALPPAIVESAPAPEAGPADRDAPDGPASVPPPVVVVPGLRRYPWLYAEPYVYPPVPPYAPGYYPPSGKLYDPFGYVGAYAPPFVTRMLDRILP